MADRADPAGFRDRLRQERMAAGLSQGGLASKAGLSPSYVSLLESGRRSPTDEMLHRLAEVLDTTAAFLEYGHHGTPDEAAQLELDFARLDLTAGDADAARQRLAELDLDDLEPSTRAGILTTLARAHDLCGDVETAIAILEPVVVDAGRRGNRLDAMAAATLLASCCIDTGDLGRACEVALAELQAAEDAGLAGTDEHLRLGATLLWAYTERGDLVSATARANRLIKQAEDFGSPRGRGSVYWNAALLAEERRNYTMAKRYAERALALLGEYRVDRDLARLRLQLGHLLLVSSPPAPLEALGHLEGARRLLSVAGSPIELATLDLEHGRALLMLGDAHGARDLAERALERLGDQPRLEASEAELVLGDAHQALSEPDRAMRSYKAAAEKLGAMSASRRAAGAWRKLAERYRAAGQLSEAVDAFARGMDEAGFPAVPTFQASVRGR